MIYDKNGNELLQAYSVDGESIEEAFSVDGTEVFPSTVDYNSFTENLLYNIKIGTQGTGVFGGYVFQVIANTYRMNVYNLSDGSLVASNIGGTYGHGDSINFSGEYYDENDLFPLLYSSADNPNYIYVNRISSMWSASLVTTLSFDTAVAGYYMAGVVDKDNNILYTTGYTNQNYLTDDSGTNKVICCKWDLNNLTQNQDTTYTPQLVDTWTVDFLYCLQGGDFHDGIMWWGSGYASGSTMHIYGIDVTSKSLAYTLTLADNYEPEGLAWINKRKLLLSQRINSSADSTYGTNYKELTFA